MLIKKVKTGATSFKTDYLTPFVGRFDMTPTACLILARYVTSNMNLESWTRYHAIFPEASDTFMSYFKASFSVLIVRRSPSRKDREGKTAYNLVIRST